MHKKAFKDSLQYGICTGAKDALTPTPHSIACRYGNPGQEIKSCPLNRIEPRTKTKCNCCNKCRDHCGWTAQVKEVNKRERKDIFDKLQKLMDDHNATK